MSSYTANTGRSTPFLVKASVVENGEEVHSGVPLSLLQTIGASISGRNLTKQQVIGHVIATPDTPDALKAWVVRPADTQKTGRDFWSMLELHCNLSVSPAGTLDPVADIEE